MSKFFKLRLYTLISTFAITWLFTGKLFFASGLTIALIGTNTIVMYLVLKEKKL